MARYALVHPDQGQIIEITREKFDVHPSMLWIDVSDRPEDDSTLLLSQYVNGHFVIGHLPHPVVPAPKE